jgi:hypothetical protein
MMNVNRETTNRALRYALAALAVFLVFQVRGSPASTQAVSTTDRLLAIEEIHQLKARYIRCLDMKDWACWEGVFAPTFYFKNGNTELRGPKAMVESTHTTGIFDRVKTVHHAHMPEIEILSPTTARGTWSADFFHYYPADGVTPQGHEIVAPGHWNLVNAFYYDTYVKIDGKWFIQSEVIHALRDEVGSLGK